MAETVPAARRLLRTVADPSGICFAIGLSGSPFLFKGIDALRHDAWTDAAAAFMVLALFSVAASAYTAAFKAVTNG